MTTDFDPKRTNTIQTISGFSASYLIPSFLARGESYKGHRAVQYICLSSLREEKLQGIKLRPSISAVACSTSASAYSYSPVLLWGTTPVGEKMSVNCTQLDRHSCTFQ